MEAPKPTKLRLLRVTHPRLRRPLKFDRVQEEEEEEEEDEEDNKLSPNQLKISELIKHDN